MTGSSDEATAGRPGLPARHGLSPDPGPPAAGPAGPDPADGPKEAEAILAAARRQAREIVNAANAEAGRILAEASNRERVLLGELQIHLTSLARAEQQVLETARRAITDMLIICRSALAPHASGPTDSGPAKRDHPAPFKER